MTVFSKYLLKKMCWKWIKNKKMKNKEFLCDLSIPLLANPLSVHKYQKMGVIMFIITTKDWDHPMSTNCGMDSIGWHSAGTLPIVPWKLSTVRQRTFCIWKLGAIRKEECRKTNTNTTKQIPSTHWGGGGLSPYY